MGFNTVAVLYNDHTHDMPTRMRDAILQSAGCSDDRLAGFFGYGMVITQNHADNSQVVIVGQNNGVLASEAKDLDWWALRQMQDCLERHGYKVTKRRKPKD